MKLFERQYQHVASGMITENFAVDGSVGRSLIFRAEYTEKTYIREFSMRSPVGTTYSQLQFDDNAKTALLELPLAEV